MGLTTPFVEAHITKWEEQLKRGNRGYRRNWPSRLFRHEPLENAVQIIKSGQLLSRAAAAGQILLDIAPEEIIHRRDVAHEYVRLYFRPKSPTQYRIEGIRKPTEYFQNKHAPVLVIFVFQALDILTAHGVEFSDGNMQSPQTLKHHSEEFFQSIPFEQVFHDGIFDPSSLEGEEIIRRRCAEVLMPSPLILAGSLQAILCRSSAERATLLHLLGDDRGRWSRQIRVYSEPGLFESRYAYLDAVDGSNTGVNFTFHPRKDGQPINTELWIRGVNNPTNLHFGPSELQTHKPWHAKAELESGVYHVRIMIEGCIAYDANFLIDEEPF